MTLIEILVVLVLIGIVMGIVGRQLHRPGRGGQAQGRRRSRSAQIANTLDLFKLEVGRYPTQQEGLQALDHRAVGRQQLERPVLEEGDAPQGSVGQRVQVHGAGREGPYDIVSLGADAKEGGDGAEQGHHATAQ